MVTRSIEAMDFLMNEKQTQNASKEGLELDKIEIPTSSPSARKNEKKPERTEEPTLSFEIPSPGRRHFRSTLPVILATLAVLIAVGIFFKRQNLTFDYLSEDADQISENLLRVGPVTATLANNDLIRLTLDIDCGEISLKKKLAKKDSLLRDKIVAVLTEPETGDLLKKQQFDEVRDRIKSSLSDIENTSIGEIYFTELLTY